MTSDLIRRRRQWDDDTPRGNYDSDQMRRPPPPPFQHCAWASFFFLVYLAFAHLFSNPSLHIR